METALRKKQNFMSPMIMCSAWQKNILRSSPPVPSIQPQVTDAIEELERCAEQGAKVLKLLPNCHNVDCSDNRYRAFWEKLAKLNMPFLAHTGGEFSVPVLNAKFADPRILRLPLECGVKVIAAHGAGKSGLWDPDYTADLLRMMDEFANLFTDNSALASPNRWRTIPALLDPKIQSRVIHGSDFPIPSGGLGPWIGKLLSGADYSNPEKSKTPWNGMFLLRKRSGSKKTLSLVWVKYSRKELNQEGSPRNPLTNVTPTTIKTSPTIPARERIHQRENNSKWRPERFPLHTKWHKQLLVEFPSPQRKEKQKRIYKIPPKIHWDIVW